MILACEEYKVWLTGTSEEAFALIKPFPADPMHMPVHPVEAPVIEEGRVVPIPLVRASAVFRHRRGMISRMTLKLARDGLRGFHHRRLYLGSGPPHFPRLKLKLDTRNNTFQPLNEYSIKSQRFRGWF